MWQAKSTTHKQGLYSQGSERLVEVVYLQLKCGGVLISELDALYIFALSHVPGHMTHTLFVQIQRLNPTTLPKIDKKDKSLVCFWRLIALFSCVFKGLERIITR
jgi:hypothetical protein